MRSTLSLIHKEAVSWAKPVDDQLGRRCFAFLTPPNHLHHLKLGVTSTQTTQNFNLLPSQLNDDDDDQSGVSPAAEKASWIWKLPRALLDCHRHRHSSNRGLWKFVLLE